MAEPEMAETKQSETRPARTPAVVKALLFTLFVSTVFLSGWTLLKYLHLGSPSVQGYVREGIKLSVSNFQIEIALAGLTGLLASVFFRGRRRSAKAKPRQLKMIPMNFGDGKPVHPLMMTQRPSRDTKFVIRKTRNRGRLSRNRMGERLPPSYVTGAESDSSA